MTPAVTVSICLYNSSHYIDYTIDSLLNQTWSDFEAILIDDGSTDGCAERVAARFPDPRLRLIRQANRGLGVARSVSVSHARGEYVAFLDHDDLWLPTKLERQIAAGIACPDAGLVFCDCLFIDSEGRTFGAMSDRYDYSQIDLSAGNAHDELLARGCFIPLSTAVVKTAALRKAGGLDPKRLYIGDYDMWLRISRTCPVLFIREPLAKWRLHNAQFTGRHPEIAAAEHAAVWRPIIHNHTYPAALRTIVGDNLLGQQRRSIALLLRQRRPGLAAVMVAATLTEPHALVRYLGGRIGRMRLRHVACLPMRMRRFAWSIQTGRRRPAISEIVDAIGDNRYTDHQLPALLETYDSTVRIQRPSAANRTGPMHVWIDGSPLGAMQTGYFNFVVETIRSFANDDARWIVHVLTQHTGRSALCDRLGPSASRIRFHGAGWQAFHWTDLHRVLVGWRLHVVLLWLSLASISLGVVAGVRAPVVAGAVLAASGMTWLTLEIVTGARNAAGQAAQSWTVRTVRLLWKLLGVPRRRLQHPDTTEIIVWRGRFRFAGSRKVAIMHDVTTRVHPELHTPGNVAEFDEFVSYLRRHAELIATVSEHSRHDIIEHLDVRPGSVHVVSSPIHPAYVRPTFSHSGPAHHGLNTPYVLCVGSIEPRKNLKRLVNAFHLLQHEDALRDHVLALAGPPGWDDTFDRFLSESDAYRTVRRLGFVPVQHLPSLYHFASAVVYPSVYEGFGLPVLEALCSSAVVVTSNASSLTELAGDTVLTFDPFDMRSIAGAILAAITMTASDVTSYRERCRARGEDLLRESPGRPSMVTLLSTRLGEGRCASPLFSRSST